MNPIDPELLSLTNELSKLGGSNQVKLSRISVFVRGVNNISSLISNVNFVSFIEEHNQIIIRHPSSANDMRCYDICKYFGPSISNDRVSAEMVNKITLSLFDGFNVNLITYGATNTGKSQLLFGSSADNMQYDCCEGLFGTLSANLLRKIDQTNDKISLSVSLWEIGHNKITDLLKNSKNHQIQSPFELTSVTILNWEEMCSVWDIAKYNSSNWNTVNTGYESVPNEANLFIQLKIYNQTQKRVTTLNIIDLVGCQHMTRSLRAHVSRDKIEENKPKNVNLFSLNKLLHHLCNLHLQNKDTNTIETASVSSVSSIQNVIAESLLNNFIGPMITQNAETIFLGTISCNASDYQSSLRTIQVLSRTLSIKVPCIHTPLFNQQNKINKLSILTFQQFLTKWQSILYKHMMIENSIQQQMNKYDENNNNNNNNNDNIINQALSVDDHELNTKVLDNQLQELRKNIPENTFKGDPNSDNKQIKQEISALLDDILDSKENDLNLRSHFLKTNNIDEMMSVTNDEKEQDKTIETVAHLNFTNLRLENCKLKEEIRKLKTGSKFSSIYDDYDREIITLHKLLQCQSNENKLLSIKNIQLKHDLNNYKLKNGHGANKKTELKTVRILQRSLRETRKQLKEKEESLMKLQSNIRHTDIRNRVLQNSKQEWYEMSQLLNERENELSKSYLSQAQTQATVDKLQLNITQLQYENNTLQIQTKSLQNEVQTLRHICKRINDDVKQGKQLQRVSKKWANKKR